MIEFATDLEELRPRIAVIGVGGAGGNAVANMIRSGVQGVEFAVANTDAQALRDSPADRILQLGRNTTSGLGAGSSAAIGRAAAEESLPEIERMLDGAHMCFIAAGLGGGTGTGAAPVIARVARARGILTVGVVTRPFDFEGTRRSRAADAGLAELEANVDTLIVIPNQNLFRIASADTTFKAAFDLADEVLQQGVRGITDLMVMPGLINLDFADIRTIMADMGKAMMGTGEASGDDRAIRAAEMAICNPLLDEAMKGARGLIISISGGDDMRLMEVDQVASHIKDLVDPEADIIWGSAFDAKLEGRIRVSVVATGIDGAASATAQVAEPGASPRTIKVPAPAPAAALLRPIADFPLQTTLVAAPAAPAPVPQPAIILTPPPALTAPAPAPVPAPLPGPVVDEELLLAGDNVVLLMPRIDAADSDPSDGFSPSHSPSLFERMASAARGAVGGRKRTGFAPVEDLDDGRVFLDRRIASGRR
jgi:cell division protein FtsZ